MPKKPVGPYIPPECPREPLGLAPAVLANREVVKPNSWCSNSTDFDPFCDPDKPKTILSRDVYRAARKISLEVPPTPLVKSKFCHELGMEVYYKMECFNQTNSYLERGAQYVLEKLSNDEKKLGVYTASVGNWGKSIAFKARRFGIPLTVVLPESTPVAVLEIIRSYGATAVTYGKSLDEAQKHAFLLKKKQGGIFVNGYDHPHVIAASGIIANEILEKLPQTDAILVPVGGGALLAGVATLAKKRKPEVLIYGIEPNTCCSFFKALENEGPYKIECGYSIAENLNIPIVGVNCYHTAVSLIDKMVLIDDDSITQAILHLAEKEKVVIDGSGAASLSVLLKKPDLLPELKGKTVVCILSSSSIDSWKFSLALQRAQAIEGRIIRVTIKIDADDMKTRLKVFSIISNVRVNLLNTEIERATYKEPESYNIYIHITCQTRDILHACTLKRVLNILFPDKCEFLEEPFSPIPICICSPKKLIII